MTATNDLPTGWATSSVGEVANYRNGRAFKPSEWRTNGSPIIRIQNLNDKSASFNFSDKQHDEKFKVRNGDLLFAWSASLGAYIWRGGEAWLNQHIFRVDHNKRIDRLFLYYALTHITVQLYAKAHGSGMVHVTKRKFEETPLRLPPFNEQRRIVAKIEELLSELDKGVENLEKAREQLKVYRHAVLKHAFEGKLTAQWREENKDKLENPEKYLARIKQARSVLYDQQLGEWKTLLAAWEQSGKSGKRPTKPPKLKELSRLSSVELETLPVLGDGWSYLRLGWVIDEPKYGTSKKCDYNYEGVGVLRIPNVVLGTVDTSDLKGAQFEAHEKRVYALRKGDILVIRSNGSRSIVGKCALISEAEEQYLYAGYLIRLRSNSAAVLPEYLATLLSCHLLRNQIEQKAKSTSGVNNINSTEIQSLVVPLCSLSEQQEVIKQLSESLSAIDSAQAEIRNQLLKITALRQTILKKAFSGQLVAQDPNDESALILLERTKAEKGRAGKSRVSTKGIRRNRAIA